MKHSSHAGWSALQLLHCKVHQKWSEKVKSLHSRLKLQLTLRLSVAKELI